jgi:hypothetical protein
MNGTLAAVQSSDAESAYSDVSPSSDSFESEKDESSDDEPLVNQAAMEASLPNKASKLARVEKICAFRCTLEGFIVCIYCRRALINVDACKSHITKFHKSQAEWLSPLPANEALDNMSMTQLQELYDRPGSTEPRKAFDGIVIQDGFKCTNCFSTFISAQTSRRHISDCKKLNANTLLIPVKCQQPLSWSNPRTKVSFQRIFDVIPDGHESLWPNEMWNQSQCGVSEDSSTVPNRLNLLLNWQHLHSATFPDIPYSVFQKLCAISGDEKWLPKIRSCTDKYFSLLRNVITSVEDAGDQRSLCKLRMNSEKDTMPCCGFYWLSSLSIEKYKSCCIRMLAFICR